MTGYYLRRISALYTVANKVTRALSQKLLAPLCDLHMKSCLMQREFVILFVNKNLLRYPPGSHSSVLTLTLICNTRIYLHVHRPPHYMLRESQDCSAVPCSRAIINNRRQLGACIQPTQSRRLQVGRDHFEILTHCTLPV